MKQIIIRQATLEDQEQILSLQSQNILDNKISQNINPEKSGFLIGNYLPTDFQNDIQQIFLVAIINHDIVAYLRINDHKEYIDNDKKIWHSLALKNHYYQNPHKEIGAIVVQDKYRNLGIAGKLLTTCCEQLKKQQINYLFSIIPLAPYRNFASLKFHEKNGFKQIASAKPSDLFGLKNYQSSLFIKEISK